MKWAQVLLLNLSGIGCCSTSKMAAQSYSHGINWWKCVRLFWYSDWLSRYQHLKLEYLKICGPYCINGHHRTNIKINIKISQHTKSFVIIPGMFFDNWKNEIDKNQSNLFTHKICSKWLYSSQNQMQDFSS